MLPEDQSQSAAADAPDHKELEQSSQSDVREPETPAQDDHEVAQDQRHASAEARLEALEATALDLTKQLTSLAEDLHQVIAAMEANKAAGRFADAAPDLLARLEALELRFRKFAAGH